MGVPVPRIAVREDVPVQPGGDRQHQNKPIQPSTVHWNLKALMSRQCSSCGAIVQDEASVFCDRCGSRLPAARPAAILTCRNCGKTLSDRQSRFCDRCGSPLASAVQDMPRAILTLRRMTCPVCGFSNTGEFLFYCRKCGSALLKTGPVPGTGPVMESRPAPPGPARRPQEGVFGIPTERTGAAYRRTAGIPAEQGPVSIPEPAEQGPAGVPAVQEPPQRRRQETQKTRGPFPLMTLAAGATGVVLLLVAVAFLTGTIPGFQDKSTANATAPDSTAPGLFESIMKGGVPNPMAIFNRAAPVVNDTPLTVNETPAPLKARTPVKTPTAEKTRIVTPATVYTPAPPDE